MKLDFNFNIANRAGQSAGPAKEALLDVLESGVNIDKPYLKKVDIWMDKLQKDGQLDLDHVDGESLLEMVVGNGMLNNMAKIPLMNYIESRIKETKKE